MPRVSIALNTFRLGGFDLTIPALERQTFQDIELLILDELHRWRAPVLAERLSRCPFPVKHLRPEGSVFPVPSTMRAGNTALRIANGQYLIHLCDYSVPPPEFIEDHIKLQEENNSKIWGINPYFVHQVLDGVWTDPLPKDVWEVIEWAIQGRDPLFWSLLGAPFGEPTEFDRVAHPPDPLHILHESPTVHFERGTKLNEWFSHWKAECAPLEALHAVNGWNEDYEGRYGYGDIDMALRLIQYGLTPLAAGAKVRILDAHKTSPRDSSLFLGAEGAWDCLVATKNRCVLEADYRCINGLVKPRAKGTEAPLWFSDWPTPKYMPKPDGELEPMMVCVSRPWLRDGRKTDLVLWPEQALQWRFVEPKILEVTPTGGDVGRFRDALGRNLVRVIPIGEWDLYGIPEMGLHDFKPTTVVLSLLKSENGGLVRLEERLEKAVSLSPKKLVVTGSLETVQATSAWLDSKGHKYLIHDADEGMAVDGVIALWL